MEKITYRNLKSYKYQLMDDYTIQIDIKPEHDLDLRFLALSKDGILVIRKAYAWDGPSGPTVDTPDFMRGSLVHDALYQLMRLNTLDYKKYRKRADEILREICLEDGMATFRAWYVYQAVQIFGESAAAPRPEPEVKLIIAP